MMPSFLPLMIVALCGFAGAGDLPAPPADAAPLSTPAPTPQIAPVRVVVTLPPLAGLVQPLVPMGSSVQILIPPGASEHGFEVSPASLAALAQADLVVSVGLGLEPQVDAFLASRPRAGRVHLVLASLLRDDERLVAPGAHDHDHDHDEDHDHDHHACAAGGDPHVWLDPIIAQRAVERLGEELAKLRPGDATLGRRTKELVTSITDLDRDYRAACAGASRTPIVVAHDAWGHLARRYGLTIVPLAGLHAGEPTPEAIKRAVDAVRASGAKTVFAEPQTPRGGIEQIARATGANVATLDPLGTGDWLGLMRDNLAAITPVLRALRRNSTTPEASTP